ncbi:invasion protein CiaB [Helicobacter labetoulli]|uniref:invasion protein CiaB n=1 Tax=Helicobacter labetoulli TaxID=2315333 RepID=UPI000EF72FAB|nr:invasion protein CiaB [Helicobacter labetoulli]
MKKSKAVFENELAQIYELSQLQSKEIYTFFDSIMQKDSKKYALLCDLSKQCELEPTQSTLMALCERIINLREDKIVQILQTQYAENENKQNKIDKARYMLLSFVMRFYQAQFENLLQSIEQKGLLSAFYREILYSTHRVGLAMNDFFVSWQKRLIDKINRDFEKTYSFVESPTNLDFTQDVAAEVSCDDFLGSQGGGEGSLPNANDRANTADSHKSTQEIRQILESSLDTDKNGVYIGRCYSIPLQVGTKFISQPYVKAFSQDVERIIAALKQSIAHLNLLEDSIYQAKEAYIAYFEALIKAWGESESKNLIQRWQEVDLAWMAIKTPLQIAHPFEYYEDIYRHSVAPEWDLRLENKKNETQSYAKNLVGAMFQTLSQELELDSTLYNAITCAFKQTSLYNSMPLLYYGAENNGLFSAQVVPNDETISSQKGKKIFAFPDRIINQAKAKPQMKINVEFFGAELLEKWREILFHNERLWHFMYDISTNGHEFGHILWVDWQSEGLMNIDGEFKNIEEFKATCGGLVAWFLHYEKAKNMGQDSADCKDLKEILAYETSLGGMDKILESLLEDHIRRCVGLMAWRKSLEVLAYYCEGLLHLSGLFQSGVLSFDKTQTPHLQIHKEHYPKLIAWYQHTYKSLANHYIQKLPANAWLKTYINNKGYHALNPQVREFVDFYWERYKSIGNEIYTPL